jgi:hypothetical protein
MRNTWAAYLVNIGPARSSGRSAASTRASSSARARNSSGSTTSRCRAARASIRVVVTDVRRPLLPAHRRRHLRRHRAFSRARCSNSTSKRTRDARGPVRPGPRRQLRLHGRCPAAPERQRVRRLGIAAVLLRVQPLGQAALGRLFPGEPDLSYRADGRAVGRPAALPARGAARASDGKTTVYASWNGATKVVSWRVLGGSERQ